MKTNEQYFADWESYAFGYGYGTGEEFVMPALRTFFETCADELSNPYDYRELEKKLGGEVTWLLINALCGGIDVIEYGTSPRYGWLTVCGKALRHFVLSKTPTQLIEIVTADGTRCHPVGCNCGPEGYEPGRVCPNPFWHESSACDYLAAMSVRP